MTHSRSLLNRNGLVADQSLTAMARRSEFNSNGNPRIVILGRGWLSGTGSADRSFIGGLADEWIINRGIASLIVPSEECRSWIARLEYRRFDRSICQNIRLAWFGRFDFYQCIPLKWSWTLNSQKYRYPVYSEYLHPDAQILIGSAQQPVVFEIQDCRKSQMHRMTSERPWIRNCQKHPVDLYKIYTLDIYSRCPNFCPFCSMTSKKRKERKKQKKVWRIGIFPLQFHIQLRTDDARDMTVMLCSNSVAHKSEAKYKQEAQGPLCPAWPFARWN